MKHPLLALICFVIFGSSSFACMIIFINTPTAASHIPAALLTFIMGITLTLLISFFLAKPSPRLHSTQPKNDLEPWTFKDLREFLATWRTTLISFWWTTLTQPHWKLSYKLIIVAIALGISTQGVSMHHTSTRQNLLAEQNIELENLKSTFRHIQHKIETELNPTSFGNVPRLQCKMISPSTEATFIKPPIPHAAAPFYYTLATLVPLLIVVGIFFIRD